MHARAAIVCAFVCGVAGAASAADGLTTPDERLVWPQWQARVNLSTLQLAPVSLFDRSAAPSASVMGDYYFHAPGLRLPALLGGLRATGGLLTGPRSPLTGYATDTSPYLGLGYTGLALKGGWGVTADIGLTLDNLAGSSRGSRALFGNQGYDGTSRELRLSPLLQFGVRYAF